MDNWYQKFNEACKKHNVEGLKHPDGSMLIICPKKLGKRAQKSIEGTLPEDMPCVFIEGPKPSTDGAMRDVAKKFVMMGSVQASPCDRKIHITVMGQTVDDPEWSLVDDILMKDGYYDEWTISLNNQEVYSKTRKSIETLQSIALDKSRDRDRVLTDDDILNVQILLSTVETVDDFIARA
jgi:hypothetical protein